MFEENLLDEEIKKKKRRILVALFALLFTGALTVLPLTELIALAPTKVALETPATAGPALSLTSTPESQSGGQAGETALQTAAPITTDSLPAPVSTETPAATDTMTPIAVQAPSGVGGGVLATPLVGGSSDTSGTGTETTLGGNGDGVTELKSSDTSGTGPETTVIIGTPAGIGAETSAGPLAGGAGAGTPVAGGTPTASLTEASPLPEASSIPAGTSTPPPPSELPVTGQSADLPGNWLAIGLLATLVGASLAALQGIRPKR